MADIFHEIRERRVLPAVGFYVGSCWVLIEILDRLVERYLLSPYLTDIANNLKGLKVLHICGRTDRILKDIAETGYDGLSLEIEDIRSMKSIVGNTRILGNVSSQKTLFSGSPEQVKAEAKKALDSGVDLLEPNCGISPTTPLQNIKAMVEARNEYF